MKIFTALVLSGQSLLYKFVKSKFTIETACLYSTLDYAERILRSSPKFERTFAALLIGCKLFIVKFIFCYLVCYCYFDMNRV